MHSSTRSFTYSEGNITPILSSLIKETPLEIIINDSSSTLIMFTPGMIKELVFGFAFTEGLIEKVGDINHFEISTGSGGNGDEVIEARITLSPKIALIPKAQAKDWIPPRTA